MGKAIKVSSKKQSVFAFVAATASISMLYQAQSAQAQELQTRRSMPDVSKMRIESPLKSLMIEKPVAQNPLAFRSRFASRTAPMLSAGRPDVSKARIEMPVKSLMIDVPARLESSRRVEASTLEEIDDEASSDPNKVKPGLVTWHKDLETAKNASTNSGKPVLVFHMMGQLDDRFC